MRPDGIQLWCEDSADVVHAAYHAGTLCGKLMDSGPSRVTGRGMFGPVSRPLEWVPVADTLKVTCGVCAKCLSIIDAKLQSIPVAVSKEAA